MAARRPRLPRLLAALAAAQGGPQPVPTRDPWHLILLENVVYLADDEARGRAFATLAEHTDLDAEVLEACPDEVLHEACGEGRMADNQVRKLRECAALFATTGDPRDLVKKPRAEARRALKRFPGIGDPGADKLLLFAGADPVLALDSNGLRVLLRLGYGEEAKSYSTSYKSAQRAAMAELPAELPDGGETLIQAHLSLKRHGRELCRNNTPACAACPLRRDCPSA